MSYMWNHTKSHMTNADHNVGNTHVIYCAHCNRVLCWMCGTIPANGDRVCSRCGELFPFGIEGQSLS